MAKLFLALVFCTAFLFSFSHFGVKAFDQFISKNTYENNTSISNLDLSGLSKSEALNLLMKKQKEWFESTTITIQYKETKKKIDLDHFHFDFKKSIDMIENGKKNELVVQVDEESLRDFLSTFTMQEIQSDTFDFDRFIQELVAFASMLEAGDHTIQIDQYFFAGEENEVISETAMKAGGNVDLLQKWTEQFPSIEIAPQSQFSVLKTMKESNDVYPSKELSIIATAIYKTVLPTNFSITERHISRELPSYAEAGYEAKVDRNKNMDFVFTNPNKEKYVLEFKMIDNLFYVSLKGSTFAYKYNVKIEDKQTFKPKTIIQYSAQLPFGKTITLHEGKDGVLVKVIRETVDKSGEVLKKERISEDFYPPVPKVISRSLIEKDNPETENDQNVSEEKSGQSTTEKPTVSNPEKPENPDQTDEPTKPSQPKNGDDEKMTDQTVQEKEQESDLWGKPDETVK
jgi:G5 domain/VanW like protein